MFFMGVLNNPSDFKGFTKIIILGVIVSAMMGILLAAEGIGLIDINISSFLEFQGAGIGVFEGTLEYNLFNMTTVIFGFPFLLALIFLPKNLSIVNKFWNYLALLALMLALITLLISGRRAFWVISLVSPLVIFVIFRMSGLANPFKLKPLFFGIVLMSSIFLIGAVVFELNFESILYGVLAGFDFGDSLNLSASARAEQFYPLLHGWMDNPLFGSGHGAAALGSVRSEEQAWAYELSYLGLLFQIGLIGSIIYFSALLWTFIKSIRFVRTNPKSSAMILPLLVGLTCFLIANATNPYLAKFDYLWTIFLPVGILNAYLLRTSIGYNSR
jgi:O-antigen ligase